MKFKKEFLQRVVSDDAEGVEVIKDEIIDTSRWSIHYNMVFKFEDKLYEVQYSCGATEQQDEQPFEYDGDEIECPEVIAVPKTVIDYVRVKK